MKDLIEALKIIAKYMDPNTKWPTACEHDVMYVCNVKVSDIPYRDIVKLIKLGFLPGSDENNYVVEDILGDFEWEELTKKNWEDIKNELDNTMFSYKYGSC